jgi:hypothetical protein
MTWDIQGKTQSPKSDFAPVFAFTGRQRQNHRLAVE